MSDTLVNLEAEREVMAALLFHGRDAWLLVASILPPVSGFAPAHRATFRVLAALAERGTAATAATFRECALSLGETQIAEQVDGVMARVADCLGSLDNLGYHANIVADLAARRDLMAAGVSLAARAENRGISVQEVVRESVSRLVARAGGRVVSGDGIWDAMQDIEAESKLNGALPGISCGIRRVDQALDGWYPERLVVVAARPGGGKTAFGLWCAHTAAGQDVETYFVTLEQPIKQLRKRQIALHANLDLRTLRTERAYGAQSARMAETMGKIQRMPLTFDDVSNTATEISLAVQRHNVNVAQVKLLIIDYLDYLRPEGKFDRHDLALGDTCRRLAQLGKQLKCCVILLVQMRRGVDGDRRPKPPVMSDLANSAEIERAADQILMLWEPPLGEGVNPVDGLATIELRIEKNRHGPKSNTSVTWHQTVNRFEQADKWYERVA